MNRNIKSISLILLIISYVFTAAQKSPDDRILGNWSLDSMGVKIAHQQHDSTYHFINSPNAKMKFKFTLDKVIKSTKSISSNAYSSIEGKWEITEKGMTIYYKKNQIAEDDRIVDFKINKLSPDNFVITELIYFTTLNITSEYRYFLSKIN